MFLIPKRPTGPRRGVTLVEMLVAVALLVLMMTIIVQVFGAATGTVSTAKTLQELDANLRQLDATIRQDLEGVTAKLTPPLNPKDNLGYLEYAENSFADIQGEDTDDYIRFTAKAPEGQCFTGRFVVVPDSLSPAQLTTYSNSYFAHQPITITSQFAEIIYFLRNGNLYRRVLLVVPERQSSVGPAPPGLPRAHVSYDYNIGNHYNGGTSVNYASSAFRGSGGLLALGFQSLNDVSAHPSSVSLNIDPNTFINNPHTVILNTLGDLTNRENRYAYSRFGNDFFAIRPDRNLAQFGDGIPDDFNVDTTGNPAGDGVPDHYPTLYPGVFAPTRPLANKLIWELPDPGPGSPRSALLSVHPEVLAFPFVFPGAYSTPRPANNPNFYSDCVQNGLGLIHTPDVLNRQLTAQALSSLNHNPIDIGDSLPIPVNANQYQTWWGFPTWRETMSVNWTDPWDSMCNLGNSFNATQPFGLNPFYATAGRTDVVSSQLPPMTSTFRVSPQSFSELNPVAGELALARNASLLPVDVDAVWRQCWEDDLIMTGVRSFDVKAYDDSFPGYVDLGWGDDLRLYTSYGPLIGPAKIPMAPPLLSGKPLLGLAYAPSVTFGASNNLVTPAAVFAWPPTSPALFSYRETYAHEGRIPPRYEDERFDPKYDVEDGNNVYYIKGFTIPFPASPYSNLINNIGFNGNVGDNNTNVLRLRRVWDTWSTDYTQAPATGFDPTLSVPLGPPFTPPIYPSYPPPYPMPLRAIQIQIRVVDPKSEQIKVLTIRQDFTDKL